MQISLPRRLLRGKPVTFSPEGGFAAAAGASASASMVGANAGTAPVWNTAPAATAVVGQTVDTNVTQVTAGGATITLAWASGRINGALVPQPGWLTFIAGATPVIRCTNPPDENQDITDMVLSATANGYVQNSQPGSISVSQPGSLLDLPLLQPSQITYLGTVTIPNTTEYPAAGIGWGESGTFLAAHGVAGGTYSLRRYVLPASTGTATASGSAANMNLSGFNNQSDLRMYGTVQIGGKVLFAASADYNGGGGAQSAFVSSLNSSFGAKTSPQGIDSLPAYVPGMRGIVGWFAMIPTEWRSLLGGYDTFCGTNCKSIVSNDTIGNAFVAFNSSAVTGSGTITTAKYLLFGSPDYASVPEQVLWYCGGRYGAGENANTAGAAIIPGTRTLLYFGHQGTGAQYYGEGPSDPCNPYYGDHAYPYEFQAWAYDMRDIVAVKNGTMQPYQPRPYQTRAGTNGWNFFGWKLNGPTVTCQRTMYTSGFYDYSTNRIYMGQTDGSLLHVWQVNV